jgi:hypothetical protein
MCANREVVLYCIVLYCIGSYSEHFLRRKKGRDCGVVWERGSLGQPEVY